MSEYLQVILNIRVKMQCFIIRVILRLSKYQGKIRCLNIRVKFRCLNIRVKLRCLNIRVKLRCLKIRVKHGVLI